MIGNHKNKGRMVYGIVFITGLFILSISLYLLKRSIAFVQQSERAVGVVTELERVRDSDGDSFKPVFKFKTITGQEVLYRHGVSTSPACWYVGEEATIAYNGSNPNEARLLTYFGTFNWTIILMAIAMPLVIVGGGYFASQHLLK